MSDDRTADPRWGWNGDLCAVWSKAIVLGETRAEKEKRARLFAAAPDLLQALEAILTSHGEQLHDAYDMAHKAIAKAKGLINDDR